MLPSHGLHRTLNCHNQVWSRGYRQLKPFRGMGGLRACSSRMSYVPGLGSGPGCCGIKAVVGELANVGRQFATERIAMLLAPGDALVLARIGESGQIQSDVSGFGSGRLDLTYK